MIEQMRDFDEAGMCTLATSKTDIGNIARVRDETYLPGLNGRGSGEE
jgi:hypothetical protein